jgi:hypothetical protein
MLANIENYVMVTSVGENALAATAAADASPAPTTESVPEVKGGEVAAAQEVAELKPGVAIIQVAKTLINGAEMPAAQTVALIEQTVPCKIAVRLRSVFATFCVVHIDIICFVVIASFRDCLCII